MAYTKPGLPNFCNIGNSSYRDKWNQNKNKNEDSKNKELLNQRANEDNARRNLNLTNEDNTILYNRNYYRNLYGGYLPGENPSNPLNNSLPPDGNNIFSKTV